MIATYTSTEVIQIIAALGTLVGVIGGVAIQVIISLRTAGKVAEVSAKTDQVSAKADDIAGKVNGAHTASQAEIQGLRAEVKALVADRAEKKEEAALLAASSHSAEPTSVIVENTPENPVPVLPHPTS